MNPIVAFLQKLASSVGVPTELVPLVPFLLAVALIFVVVLVLGRVLVRAGRIRSDTYAFWLFVSPWCIGFAIFVAGPMLYSIWLSLNSWDLINPPQWVGLDNFIRAAGDPLLLKSLQVTFYYVIVSVPLQVVLAFLVAVLMSVKVHGIAIFRTAWYLPSLIVGVPQIVLFVWVFNPSHGLINSALGTIGIQGPGWLNDPTWAMPAVILMSLWTVGGSMVIYLAGLKDVPPELYEAAEIDGAPLVARFRHITIPQLSPIIFFSVITGFIGAMQIFTQGYVATANGGGPQNSLLFFVFYLYQNAFNWFHMGYGAALAWILFVIIMILTYILFRAGGLVVYYETDQDGRR